jgi:hypothetical protein
MSIRLLLVTIATGTLFTACDRVPTAASSVPSGPHQADTGDTYLLGWVHNTVNRPVAGALIEIVDGPRAVAHTTSDDRGAFGFVGGRGSAVTLRVSRDGFAATTMTAAWSTNANQRTNVVLKSLEPPLAIVPGAYTMTLISDPSATGWFGVGCAGFPPELLRRTYDATIAPATQVEGFVVRYTNPTLLTLPGPFGFGFTFTQAGQFIGFELEVGFGSGPTELLSEHRYLTVSGVAPTSEPATLTENSLMIPFWATFEYCQLTSPMGRYNACSQVPANQRVEYYSCASMRDVMVFTKR